MPLPLALLSIYFEHSFLHLQSSVALCSRFSATGRSLYKEGSLGTVLPFINIKTHAQWLQDRMRNPSCVSSCSALPTGGPALCRFYCNLVPKRHWKSPKLWFCQLLHCPKNRGRDPSHSILIRSHLPREDRARWAKLPQYNWLSDGIPTTAFPML